MAPRATEVTGQDLAAARSAVVKRITAGIRGSSPFLANKLNSLNTNPGVQHLERLVNAGLANPDTQDALHPQLAETLPTLENGLWRLFPDGRMETTWKLRPNAVWHDGAPFSSEDVVFTARAEQERGLAWVRNPAYEALDRVEAPDAHTVTIFWRQPYVEADYLFTASTNKALPLPKHILEAPFEADRANLLQHPYWSVDFVGTGPYKLRTWERDSHVILVANDEYVLGRPKIDEIVVRFIGDSNTLIANLLAGEVQLSMDGRSISFEEGRQAQEQWRDGRLELGVGGVLTYSPQFLSFRPPVLADPRFRRALVLAIDRQEMADTIQGGLAPVADINLDPASREARAIEGQFVRYPYDVRRATQLLEEMGFTRGTDGVFRDASLQPLEIEVRTTVTQVNQKAQAAVADYWQRFGLRVESATIPLQRQGDREYVASFPSVLLTRSGSALTSFRNYTTVEAALPENSFAGGNRGRYRNPEYDALVDSYYQTIPFGERMQVLGQIFHHQTDQVVVMRLFFDPEATMAANRLKGVPAGVPWNVHEWDLI